MIFIIYNNVFNMKVVQVESIDDAKSVIKHINPVQYVIIRGEYLGSSI